MTAKPNCFAEELRQREIERAADFHRRRAQVYATRAAFAAARQAGLRRRHARKRRGEGPTL